MNFTIDVFTKLYYKSLCYLNINSAKLIKCDHWFHIILYISVQHVIFTQQMSCILFIDFTLL